MSRHDPAERQVRGDSRGAGGLEQPRRQQAASLGHHGIVELVFDALLQRRHLASRSVVFERLEVAVQDRLHLVDRDGGLGAEQLDHGILGRRRAGSSGRCASCRNRDRHRACPAARRSRRSKRRGRTPARTAAGRVATCSAPRPGPYPRKLSEYFCVRYSGTNASSMTMSWLPVPFSPGTCQVSTIS